MGSAIGADREAKTRQRIVGEPMPASSGTTIIGLGDSYSVIQYGVNEPVKLTRKQYFKKLKAYIKSLFYETTKH